MLPFTRVWRRSLRTRVVAQTVILSSVMIVLIGWVLLHNVADGLAENRRVAAIDEAQTGITRAQQYLDAAVGSRPEQQSRVLTQLIDTLTATSGTSRTFDVLLYGPVPSSGPTSVRSSGALNLQDIPVDLKQQVETESGLWWRFSELGVLASADSEAAVIVGSRLSFGGDHYVLFYVFSLAEQQATLDLVRDSLLVGALFLVLLLAAVSMIVARQAVTPLEEARNVAEQIAAGDLKRRMQVVGEDDIARLSISFNQMAEALQSQIQRLEKLSMLQQRFVSDVSHELRTPLTTVQMAAQILNEARHELDPPAARAAELLTNELERFEALLSDLLDLSRIDAGAEELEVEPLDMSTLLREIVERKEVTVADCDVVLIGTEVPVIVEADTRRLDRIFRNLLLNAVKYSESDRIEIELESTDDIAQTAVRDFGIGLTSGQLERIFDRFWRADPARSAGGTGLGLAIAREDAILHGGSLEVSSTQGEGTEFVLKLPCKQRASQQTTFDQESEA